MEAAARGSREKKLPSGRWYGVNVPRAPQRRRAFAIDVLACPHCGGRLRLIGTLRDPAVIRKILEHVGIAHSGPSHGPAPPEFGAAAP